MFPSRAPSSGPSSRTVSSLTSSGSTACASRMHTACWRCPCSCCGCTWAARASASAAAAAAATADVAVAVCSSAQLPCWRHLSYKDPNICHREHERVAAYTRTSRGLLYGWRLVPFSRMWLISAAHSSAKCALARKSQSHCRAIAPPTCDSQRISAANGPSDPKRLEVCRGRCGQHGRGRRVRHSQVRHLLCGSSIPICLYLQP